MRIQHSPTISGNPWTYQGLPGPPHHFPVIFFPCARPFVWQVHHQQPSAETYRFSGYGMKDLEPTLEVLNAIVKERRTHCSAITPNYNISKGAVPTVRVRSPAQAQQISAALGWRLNEDEVSRIDKVSTEGKSTVL